jgi:hypothetical protein
MARLSDGDSSWRASGLRRRFEDWENSPRSKPITSGKNRRRDTKRWCRGKEGREHEWAGFQKYPFVAVPRCVVCHKEDWSRATWSKLL